MIKSLPFYFKKIILSLIIFLGLLCFFTPAYAQNNKQLEVDYIAVPNSTLPISTDTSLPDYIKYIFILVMSVSGFLGLAALIYAGVLYINSAGNIAKQKEARSRLVSAFWGGILLLGSYVLLRTINPNLTELEVGRLENIPPSEQLPSTQITSIPTADILTRIKIMAQKIQETMNTMRTTSTDIQQKSSQCDCQNTKPVCVCEDKNQQDQSIFEKWLNQSFDAEVYSDYYAKLASSNLLAQADPNTNLECKAKSCFAGNNSHPCKDYAKLDESGKKIVDEKDVVLYYKNRLESEVSDLTIDISNYLNKQIEWYQQQLNSSQSIKENTLKQRTIEFLNERKGWLEDERNYKIKLTAMMQALSQTLPQIEEPANKLPGLINKCFENVKDKCTATCKQGQDNGCHDKVKGCQPDKCSGGNPCPTSEIQQETAKIQGLSQSIYAMCQQIISSVDSIQKVRTSQIHF